MLRDAMSAAYEGPEFFNDYKKITGEAPSPLTPDEFDEVRKKLPRDPKDSDLFKKSPARARCLPARFVETHSAYSVGPLGWQRYNRSRPAMGFLILRI